MTHRCSCMAAAIMCVSKWLSRSNRDLLELLFEGNLRDEEVTVRLSSFVDLVVHIVTRSSGCTLGKKGYKFSDQISKSP